MISQETIDRCKHKEQQAFKECYEKCAPYVYTIVKSYIYEVEFRKDAMQEIFAQIFLSLNKYDPAKGKFKSWIAQISIYQSIAILRKRKTLNLFVPMDLEHENIGETEIDFSALKKEDIEKLLLKMPTGYRTIFLLSVIDDYKHKEIAEMLGITAETSRSQLSRAIHWIKKKQLVDIKNFTYG